MADAREILVGTRKGLFRAVEQGGRWTLARPVLKGIPVSYAVRDSRDGLIWAALDHGHWGPKLAVSTDGGVHFEEAAAPKYPESTRAAARYYWVIEPGPGTEPGTLWIGTEPGGLFVTRDGGRTWALVESLWALREAHRWMGGGRDEAGIHSICLDPRDRDHLYVAVSCAGVLETVDGGDTWAYRNAGVRTAMTPDEGTEYGHDPHCLAMSPGDPDVLWQQNHLGVYRTADGGTTWQDLTQKPLVDFGFPIAPSPVDPDVAWIVPMESDQYRMAPDGALVVMRTGDGGATWHEGRAGLPQADAWDFPLRHAFDVAPDGRSLVFGTTSGNLYGSCDGGERWTAITHGLPAVYSVRYASDVR